MTQADPADGHRPDARYSDPAALGATLEALVLPCVIRPASYLGGETGACRVPWRDERANVLLAFPDAYEIGMSHTGLRVLYAQLNRDGGREIFADFTCAPWPDMEARMRELRLPLYGLQTRRPARCFDVVGFTLAWELTYTNILTMLDLAGLPLRAGERRDGDPIVIAGGHGACSPGALAPFVDVFFLGDGEETVREVGVAVLDAKRAGEGRAALLARLGALEGAWRPDAPRPARPRRLPDLGACEPPSGPVPVTEPVHDRLTLEVMRGCARGCRFCQAGMLTRPVRERDASAVAAAAAAGVAATGWDEVSLLSLSAADYSALAPALRGAREALAGGRTNLVLPSLRVDALDPAVYGELHREEPGSFTFAPEAGSQRLRDVVNKNVTDEDVLESCGRAFAAGAKSVKLYFMIGLPTETDDDLRAIVDLAGRVARLAPRGAGQITVSVSPFVPKPHTPFQWAGQSPRAEIARRNALLETQLARLRVKVSLRRPEVSALEAVLGLGDADCAEALLAAWRDGARFDGWSEWFDADRWDRACAAAGVDTAALLAPRDPEAPLPWDGILAVDPGFLREEWARALRGETTPDCRLEGQCAGCGACGPASGHVTAAPVAPDQATVSAAVPPTPFDPRNASRDDPSQERRRWTVWRNQAPQRCWQRVEYTKLDAARFLGHLDFQRLFRLALRRAGVPMAYSQGFHPHPLLKFGPPLPVGVEGERELCDIALARSAPGWLAALNAELPAGVRVVRAAPVGPNLPEAVEACVGRADYRAVLPRLAPEGADGRALARRIAAFEAAAAWPWTRKREKGDVELDVRPLLVPGSLSFTSAEQGGDGALQFSLVRDASTAGLPPHEFLAALCGPLLPEPRLCRVRRTAMLGRDAAGRWRSPIDVIGEINTRRWLRRDLYA